MFYANISVMTPEFRCFPAKSQPALLVARFLIITRRPVLYSISVNSIPRVLVGRRRSPAPRFL